MFSLYKADEVLDDFILRFSDCTLSLPEKEAFMEVMDQNPVVDKTARSGKIVSRLFKQLPPHKAGRGFEQKMAAAFALELEKEQQSLNNRKVAEDETVN